MLKRRRIYEGLEENFDSNIVCDVLTQDIKQMSPKGWVKTNRWVDSRHFGCSFTNDYIDDDVDLYFTFEWEETRRGPVITDYDVKIYGINDVDYMLLLTSKYLSKKLGVRVPRWDNSLSVETNVENILDYVEEAINESYNLDEYDIDELKI